MCVWSMRVGDREEEGRKSKRKRECILTALCEAVVVTCPLSEEDSVSQRGRAQPAGMCMCLSPWQGREGPRGGENPSLSLSSLHFIREIYMPKLLCLMLANTALDPSHSSAGWGIG